MSERFEHPDPRVRTRAERLWQEAGRPAGREADYLERARELLAIEDNPDAGKVPVEQSIPAGAEPPEALENQGEFPGLADQGDESPARPRRDHE